MNNVFYIGATGLQAQQGAVSVVSNNITNMNTAGYKRALVSFAEMVAPATLPGYRSGALPVRGQDILQGVAFDGTTRVFTPGDLRQTGNPFDIAIKGEGFLEIMAPGGQTLLTRGGTLRINEDGYLSVANGMPLKPAISVPVDATSLSIATTGKVYVVTSGQPTPTEIGQLELVSVADTRRLLTGGNGLYRLDENARDVTRGLAGEDGLGSFSQASLETSNVQLTEELVSLLLLQRAYGASAKVVQAGDELMGIVNGLKR
ncbi:flagellar hook-basal body complex protein [Cupriavidus basilensis]|uniref:Flagellar hook-basal body complex protein n=1 Tax=Cupriavidus basilensis TaxID=68895 RepID=A0ABT6AW31_9BURK|nr:flagellar hook-basal body complex protein [Cupriavidus basilensis]MDF3836836.1 flagellar hook-basal body complex protein [Cupriavidus basilensis]